MGHSRRTLQPVPRFLPCLSDRHSEKQAAGPEQMVQLHIALLTADLLQLPSQRSCSVKYSPVCLYRADEELRAIGVGACVRHGQDTCETSRGELCHPEGTSPEMLLGRAGGSHSIKTCEAADSGTREPVLTQSPELVCFNCQLALNEGY